ncbi:hypothetical protein Tco_0216266 [Tanacetum coccineum]
MKQPLHEGHTSEVVKDMFETTKLMCLFLNESPSYRRERPKRVVVSDLEDEETEAQRRKIQELDDDPLVSLVKDFVTPTKTNSASREAQEEDISPTTLEAAKTLSKVASQKARSIDKGRRYKRRKVSKGKDAEAEEEEAARQVYLDALLAKRITEEEELSEQQKKRKAEVQEAAQNYTKGFGIPSGQNLKQMQN